MSYGALCATRTASCANSRNAGSTEDSVGAWATSAFVMPVSVAMNGGISRCGLTNVAKVPMRSPPRTLTAPTSVMPASRDGPPVVSRSTITNVTWSRRSPMSSKAPCIAARYALNVTSRSRNTGRPSPAATLRTCQFNCPMARLGCDVATAGTSLDLTWSAPPRSRSTGTPRWPATCKSRIGKS